MKRWACNVAPAPTFVEFGGYSSNVDIWQISEFRPPSYVRVSYGSAPAGSGIPEGDGIWTQGKWGFQVYHGITPETERTTHQLRYVVHQFGRGDAAELNEFYRQCDQIINEDVTVFAAQQRALDTGRTVHPPGNRIRASRSRLTADCCRPASSPTGCCASKRRPERQPLAARNDRGRLTQPSHLIASGDGDVF